MSNSEASPELRMEYAQVEAFAGNHDHIAGDLAAWAVADPDFAERYLATHGKVNYAIYLRIREFMASKQVAGTALADLNARTSKALRTVVAMTDGADEAGGDGFTALRV